ncbi:hypothetical protein BZB76_2080 [Actinomadura pelletieri DSM 43383]|uniref:Uncharacterized protein n=1 Tax=Actinomadura pelletieri DSM 43383 TaxID=1120940 RepID=A0A495QT76_9ACTN|nr:hypothetical protein [Actinomadura pelletieri]RKS76722.1 hypothetical protein BZB76_2080 [Actinomadura pelletieri DSM 43383]
MTVHIRPSSVYPHDPSDPGPGGLLIRTRLTGAALVAGTTAWITGLLIAGDDLQDDVVPVEIWGSLAFLLGVASLVVLVLSTNATGSRKGRYIPIVELVLLVPAMIWCPLIVAYPEDTPAWVIPFDICWPLSMLGMLVIGIAVAKVGRFRGVLRWQVLLCGLWLVVAGAGQAALGDEGGTYPGAAWLGISYGVLGLRLAVTPRIVLPAAPPVPAAPVS